MRNKETIDKLKLLIFENLKPLISNKVILTDLPYHINVGDLLIWQGEIDFLKTQGKSVLSQTSLHTFTFPKLDKDVTILLHGGGNLGDLYRNAQDFRLRVINHYPDNRIIVFPQSVWYEDQRLIAHDFHQISKHNDLYICARDLYSYNFIKKHFPGVNLLLTPDMAFCIDIQKLPMNSVLEQNRKLYFRRLDKEYIELASSVLSNSVDVRDWPSFENTSIAMKCFLSILFQLKKKKCPPLLYGKIFDYTMRYYFKKYLIREGVDLIQSYKEIYTTRLHAMILGILLDKKVYALDNSTKKLSSFYNTWLTENADVQLL